ncbi:MAG: hypothetical protein US81_C0002G0008 [Parcubacteria group bacterium GW2011_GWE2_38_18]|nr:MAG: hypothetical protein US81_C0002G0008 [Parcubacteria group bacterium GW2011_GWE2_38_18]
MEKTNATPTHDKNSQGSVFNFLSKYLPTKTAIITGVPIQALSFVNKIKLGCHQGV